MVPNYEGWIFEPDAGHHCYLHNQAGSRSSGTNEIRTPTGRLGRGSETEWMHFRVHVVRSFVLSAASRMWSDFLEAATWLEKFMVSKSK